MSVVHQEKPQSIDLRAILFLLACLGSLAVVVSRLWYFQVVQSDALSRQAEASRSSFLPQLPPRGLIVDREGRTLAGVEQQLVVTAQPRAALANEEGIKKLASILEVDPEDLRKELKRYGAYKVMPTPIYTDISIQKATRIAEAGDLLKGFAVDSLPVRSYANAKAVAHVLGYVGTPSEKDVERLRGEGIEPVDFVGRAGLERALEKELMGVPGRNEVVVDNRNRPVRTVTRDASVPGNKVVLGLDVDLQNYALQLLGGRAGAAVAIDPTNGEILLLVSSPTYDASLFLGGISHKEYAVLTEDPLKPMLNRAIGSPYAPGSTFKISTALAAELAGKFDPNAPITVCRGAFMLGRHRFRCLGHHGATKFHDAFKNSCNAYFMQLALNAGRANLQKAADLLGIEHKTGVELQGESAGIAPSDAWINRVNDGQWTAGTTVLMGIGQGFTSTTCLQMANLMATVANNGVRYRPHLVRALQGPDDPKPVRVSPEIETTIKVRPEFWAKMKAACLEVVETGTARGSRIPGLAMGGKTGSAENKKDHKTHSWFVGFAPVDKPRIAIAVIVENAGHGSEVGAPVGTKLMARYLNPKAAELPQPKTSGAPQPSQARR